MSDAPDWDMQQAIYARLTAELGAGVKVVDNMESSAFEESLPFVLIGDDQLVDAGTQCGEAYEYTTAIRCHAAGNGRKGSKVLAAQVRDAMRLDEFTLTDWDVSNPQHVGSQATMVGEKLGHLVTVTWQFELDKKS